MRVSRRRLLYGLALCASLLVTTSSAGRSTHGAMFVRAMLELLAFLALAWLPGQALLWQLQHRLELSDDDLLLLAVPTTLAAYTAVGIPLLCLSAPAWLFKLVLLPCVGLAIVVLVRRLHTQVATMIPNPVLFTCALAACALCFVCVGQAAPWKTMSWTVPATRALHPMPIDNALQFMTAEVFIAGSSPWTIPGWTMGDRPPFLGLLTSIYAKAFLFRKINYFDYTILAIVCNALYAIPLVRLAQRFLVSERIGLLAALSIALTPFAFLNVFFTWPKYFGLFFTLTPLALFLRRDCASAWRWPSLRAAVVVGALLGLSSLCHGGSVLSAPLVLLLISLFPARGRELGSRRPWRRDVLRIASATAIAAICVLAMNVPWNLYKHWHPEADTNRLTDQYLPLREGTTERLSVREWLAITPPSEQLRVRWSRVEQVVTGGQFSHVARALYSGDVMTFDAQRWPSEMFRAVTQVGELRIVIGLFSLLAFALWRALANTCSIARPGTLDIPLCAATLLASLASYLVNVFAKWEEVVPHALPMAEVVLTALALSLAVLGFSPLLTVLLLAAILQRFLYHTVATTFARGLPVDLFALGIFAAVAGLLWLALRGGVDVTSDPSTRNSEA
jgi:hypothetical protein